MMAEMLSELGYTVIGQVRNFDEGVQSLNIEKPDICMLDINLGIGKDGIDLASFINENYSLPFVFVTSNVDSHTIKRAKEEVPYGYLTKPFTKEDLYTSIEMAINNFNRLEFKKSTKKAPKEAKSMFIKDGTVFVKVHFDQLVFVKSEGNYVEVQTLDSKYLIRSSMKEFAAKLPETRFIQCHRSYLVNHQLIDSLGHNFIRLKNHEVPLSKQLKDEVTDFLLGNK